MVCFQIIFVELTFRIKNTDAGLPRTGLAEVFASWRGLCRQCYRDDNDGAIRRSGWASESHAHHARICARGKSWLGIVTVWVTGDDIFYYLLLSVHSWHRGGRNLSRGGCDCFCHAGDGSKRVEDKLKFVSAKKIASF